jgi:hypothetical protein
MVVKNIQETWKLYASFIFTTMMKLTSESSVNQSTFIRWMTKDYENMSFAVCTSDIKAWTFSQFLRTLFDPTLV